MSFPIKACLFGGAGCLTAIGIALSQSESSLSVREKLGIEGYELISYKEKVASASWKAKATDYKKVASNNGLILPGLSPDAVDTDGKVIENKCKELTDIKVSFNIIKEIYEKVIKLCTLNIKEYLESNFNEGDKFIEKGQTGEADWKANFKKYKDKIKEKITDAEEENVKEKLSDYCEKSYILQYSNKTKTERSNVEDWCIKKKEPAPAEKKEE